jgi:hypothetical protein
VTNQQIPDVSDPDVREMVLSNHRPAEALTGIKDQRTVVVGCAMCFQLWPCPSIQAARAAESSRKPAAR